MKTEDIQAMKAALQKIGIVENGNGKKEDDDGVSVTVKKRRAINKSPTGKSKTETEVQVQEFMSPLERYKASRSTVDVINEDVTQLSSAHLKYYATKKFPHGRYTSKEISDEHRRRQKAEPNYHTVKASLDEATGQESINKTSDPAGKVAPKEIKQGKEQSVTKDTSKLDKKQAPKELDAEHAHTVNRSAELAANKAASNNSVKESVELNEDYHANQMRYVEQLKKVAAEIFEYATRLNKGHTDAIAARKRINSAYKLGKVASDADIQISNSTVYDAKGYVRNLEDVRDQLEQALPKVAVKEDVKVEATPVEEQSRFGKASAPETRTPLSTRDALAMMEERDGHLKGATKPQTYDDTWSGKAKEFANVHKVAEPDYADINKVAEMNKTEVGASLNRSVKYRHNDQTLGDKKPVGNDGK